jgi:hypothetical protein
MNLRSRFYLALIVAIITITIHAIFDRLYLYWTIPSVDIITHFLGGLMSALFVLTALRFLKWKETFAVTIVAVFCIGIAWEVLEIYFKVADIDFAYWLDTIGDLVNDIFGGVVGYFIWKALPEVKASDVALDDPQLK